jgi:hypothetical protein
MAALLVLLLVSQAGGDYGWDGFARMNFGYGARELAMGGAATGSCNSAAASYWNPGSLGRVTSGTVSAYSPFRPVGRFHEPTDSDVFMAWAQPFSGTWALGLAADRFNLGGIELRSSETKAPDDTGGYSETYAWLCGALRLTSGVHAGAGLCMGEQRLGSSFSDIGFAWLLGVDMEAVERFRAGLTLRLAPVSTGENDVMSSKVAFGLAYEPVSGLVLAADANRRWQRPLVFGLGAEYRKGFGGSSTDGETRPLSTALRVGLKDLTPSYSSDSSWVGPASVATPTAGVGIEYAREGFRIGIDYVWIIGHAAFGDIHAIGATISY